MRGILSSICGILRALDRTLGIEQHTQVALDWLLKHQESDGSFFSSVHMTSIAVVTLHRLDAPRFASRIQSGLDAMRKWQLTDGRTRWQQFTDSTNWDTFLFLDLLRALDVQPNSSPSPKRSELHHFESVCASW